MYCPCTTLTQLTFHDAEHTEPNDSDADGTQLSGHKQRPEGPARHSPGPDLTQEEAAVRTSLVAALDLAGQVQPAHT